MAARDQAWVEAAHAAFGHQGHRAGGARRQVLDLLSEQSCCLSAQEIADRVRSGGATVGLASVYRALDVLHDAGLLQRVEVGEGGTRYEPVLPGGEHHHHVLCESCGRITPFSDEALESAIHDLGERLGHSVGGHEVLIRGACRRCQPAPRRR